MAAHLESISAPSQIEVVRRRLLEYVAAEGSFSWCIWVMSLFPMTVTHVVPLAVAVVYVLHVWLSRSIGAPHIT